MFVKNGEYVGYVTDYGCNGEGVIKENENIIFVPFCLKGEKIKYKALKITKNIVYGKLLEVIEPSLNRATPKCPVFNKCGGCNLQHIKYTEQLEIKRENIKDCFYKYGGLCVEPEDVVIGKNQFNYRNKLQLPVSFSNGETIIGFYRENSHDVIAIDDCCINPCWTKDIIAIFKNYFNKFDIKGYNEKDFSGQVRELAVKEIKGKLIITIVSLTEKLKGIDYLIDKLKVRFNEDFSLFINLNTSKNNVIFGDKFFLKYGKPNYSAEMLKIKYNIGVQSFMQVNSEICEKLYKTVVNEIDADENTTVIDAYSGAGLMTAILSLNAKKAIGIEIVKEAVELADKLKNENGLADKVFNFQGKCEEIMPDIIKKERENNSKVALVLDPPRKGCDINVINSIINSNIEKICYVSCLPQTLARDVGLITGKYIYDGKNIVKINDSKLNYKVSKVIPFDMFPNTKHVETLCVLEKV